MVGIFSFFSDPLCAFYDNLISTRTESCRAVMEMLTLCVEVGLKNYLSVLNHPNLPTFIGNTVIFEPKSSS